ncbi:uncharacterized protein NFIA_060740 [Aspergillus fischeri NRRL 181]|uniref:Uncharacterized protein n=1 Tax=Neosartorya fischeri (strain ATCC 1020 / DSM 3700 / CBS 544.65 / FGSC A1164 / JCM 1740 / NRRL 181 / WB 181) TaxID=331117 RepID=A1DPJ7_NEOFI|nr:uncharacterized protein NFIA_060740 [Aspergillus fischeri NRRL 181]EAW16718.1 hypothetical protein NFIA_060740 [Aspergillus fischeri NRRL 181]KAG2002874.1 hypothetical protein GB937_009410 [Aspergillus fischeri]
MTEYQANLIDSTSTKVPIILDKPDDWWTWIGYIESIAKKWNIWKYLDPEDEMNQDDEPKEPVKPVPAKQYGSMNLMEQFDWTQTRKDYKDARHLYEKKSAGMMNIWNTIQSTVSLKHWHILKDKKLSERKCLVKLKKKLKPSQQSRIASLKL